MPQISGRSQSGFDGGASTPPSGSGTTRSILPEQRAVVLGDLAAVAGATAVAGADPQGAVGPEHEVAAVVVLEGLADLEVEHAVAGLPGRPSAPSGHDRISVSPAAVGVVEVQPLAVGIDRRCPSRPRSPPVVIRSLMSSTTSVVPVSGRRRGPARRAWSPAPVPGPGGSATAAAPGSWMPGPRRRAGPVPVGSGGVDDLGQGRAVLDGGRLRGAVGGAGVGRTGDGQVGREPQRVAPPPGRRQQRDSRAARDARGCDASRGRTACRHLRRRPPVDGMRAPARACAAGGRSRSGAGSARGWTPASRRARWLARGSRWARRSGRPGTRGGGCRAARRRRAARRSSRR